MTVQDNKVISKCFTSLTVVRTYSGPRTSTFHITRARVRVKEEKKLEEEDCLWPLINSTGCPIFQFLFVEPCVLTAMDW